MSKKFKPALATLLITTMLLSQSTVALAFTTFNNHVLNGGVGNYGYNNRYYYITSSAGGYSSLITSAMNDWIYTTSRLGITTPVSFLRTYTQSSSVMDIYAGYYKDPSYGIVGYTTFWIYGTQIDPMASNWGWGKIRLNQPNYDWLSAYDKQGTAAHEMGHVMGLNENNSNPGSVMCQLAYGRYVNSAQADDCNGINYLY